MKDLKTLTGPELVAEYNALAQAAGVDPVRRFADRKVGLRRTEALAALVNDKGQPAVVPATEAPASAETQALVAGTEIAGGAADEAAAATAVNKTILDAHTAEVEGKGATFSNLGISTEVDSITSQTSKGLLMTRVGTAGFIHEWEDAAAEPLKAKGIKRIKAAPAPKAPKSPGTPKKKSTGTKRADMVIAVTDKVATGTNPKKPGSDGAAHFDAMAGQTVGAYLAKYHEGKPRKTASQWLGNFVREGLVELKEPGQ